MSSEDTQQQSESEGNLALSPPSAHFFAMTGPGAGGCYVVSPEGVSVGRAAGSSPADISFEDPRMSRAHARLERGPSGWSLVDLGSRNGGFVNGVPVAPATRSPLYDGAVIRLGDTLLVFREGKAPTGEPGSQRGLEPAAVELAAAIGGAERGAFPGRSTAAHVIRRRIAGLCERSGHVLVLGETGTGKERVARALAPRSDMPFIVQNCAELTRDLARSELFGHLRGAFTGAHSNRSGLVEAAGDGVLFLDEIGELPLEVQGELLRFLEDGTYRPLGSLELRKSRARIVAATNVDLDVAVRGGTFRRDLLARLRASNAPLELPPLRERREDLLGWARTFAAELNAETLDEEAADDASDAGALRGELWAAGALECLLLYSWPENLRELRGVVRELCDSYPGVPVGAEVLPERVRIRRANLRTHTGSTPTPFAELGSVPAVPTSAGGPLVLPLAKPPAPLPTREEIERALASENGNMKAAAQVLSIERRRLYRLCESLGIPFESYRAS